MAYEFVYLDVFDVRDNETGRFRCRYCGKVVPKGRKKHYCSDECRRKFYYAYSWDRVRKEVWERDGGRCVSCGAKVELYGDDACEIHHKTPARELRWVAWDVVKDVEDERKRNRYFTILYYMLLYDQDNLVTLCSKCHRAIEGNRRKARRFVDYFSSISQRVSGRAEYVPERLLSNNRWKSFIELMKRDLFQSRLTQWFSRK